jgi:hypothetical protein
VGKNFGAVLLGAAVLAVAAPALASTTMTFRIDITGSSGLAPVFSTPFLETFTLQDGVLNGFGSSTDLMGDVSGADSLTEGLKALTNLTGETDSSNWDLGVFISTPPPFLGLPPSIHTQGDIFENLFGQGGAYRQSIDGGALTSHSPPSQDAAGLADFFRQGQTLAWYEEVLDSNFTVVAGYTGTATLTAFSGVFRRFLRRAGARGLGVDDPGLGRRGRVASAA